MLLALLIFFYWYFKKRTYVTEIEKTNFTLMLFLYAVNPLSANLTKWSNTLKQFDGKFPTNCLVCLANLWDWHLKG